MTVKGVFASLAIIASAANAQCVTVDETSNFGNLTRPTVVSPFCIDDVFTIYDYSAEGYVLQSIQIEVFGEQGYRSCGKSCSAQFEMSLAQPTGLFDDPAAFKCAASSAYGCWKWVATEPFAPGSYDLHLTGIDCGGAGCKLPGYNYVFVQVKLNYTYAPL